MLIACDNRGVGKSRWDAPRTGRVNGYFINENRNLLSGCSTRTEGINIPGQCPCIGVVGNRATITWIWAYDRRWSNVGKSSWDDIFDDNPSCRGRPIVCRCNCKFNRVSDVWCCIRNCLEYCKIRLKWCHKGSGRVITCIWICCSC